MMILSILNLLHFICFALIPVTFSQVIIQRIFDKDGTLLNQTLPASETKITGKRPIPYDVFQIPSGYFFLNWFFVVADEKDRIIEPASGHLVQFFSDKDLSKENKFLSYHKTQNITVESNVLYLRQSCHYWHFHYETIAQLYFYELAGIFDKYAGQNNSILLAPTPCDRDPLYSEILRFFGFDKKLQAFGPRLSLPGGHQRHGIRTTKNLIISTNTGIAGTVPNLPTVRFIHQKAMENARNHHKFRPTDRRDTSYFHRRIFVDREEGFKRRLTNRDELLQMLAKYDIYDYLPATNTSYAKQMYLFSHAELVIGPSGTGFSTNIAFCNPNSTVLVEIFPYFPHTTTGIIVSKTLGFKQYHEFRKAYDGEEQTMNFKVNVTALDDLLFDILSADR